MSKRDNAGGGPGGSNSDTAANGGSGSGSGSGGGGGSNSGGGGGGGGGRYNFRNAGLNKIGNWNNPGPIVGVGSLGGGIRGGPYPGGYAPPVDIHNLPPIRPPVRPPVRPPAWYDQFEPGRIPGVTPVDPVINWDDPNIKWNPVPNTWDPADAYMGTGYQGYGRGAGNGNPLGNAVQGGLNTGSNIGGSGGADPTGAGVGMNSGPGANRSMAPPPGLPPPAPVHPAYHAFNSFFSGGSQPRKAALPFSRSLGGQNEGFFGQRR